MYRKDEPILYLVLPCFNEAETLPNTIEKLDDKIEKLVTNKIISNESKLLFVNDGSDDESWSILKSCRLTNERISAIDLSKNKGHQVAVMAGLLFCKDKADMAISIDADLQQDINAIDEMILKYKEGCDVVFGIRNDRKSDGKLKKISALMFYSLMRLMGCDIIKNHADYRLLSKCAIESLSEYGEVNLFLRGLVLELGYKTDKVYFDVNAREYGESKYTLKKMLRLAIDGITSFSVKPLSMIFGLGIGSIIVSVIMIIDTMVRYCKGLTVPGWSTVVCSVWFLGGIQLLALGIIGEYIGKTYIETKKRPKYHIREII